MYLHISLILSVLYGSNFHIVWFGCFVHCCDIRKLFGIFPANNQRFSETISEIPDRKSFLKSVKPGVAGPVNPVCIRLIRLF